MNLMDNALHLHANPFIALTFIVAPAVLTNASAVLVMSTSNRFARAIDRAREISRQIESVTPGTEEAVARLIRELSNTENHGILLIKAMRSFYLSMGAFATAAFVSLLGIAVLSSSPVIVSRGIGLSAMLVGFVAVGGLVHGSALLLKETRITVSILQDRINALKQKKIGN